LELDRTSICNVKSVAATWSSRSHLAARNVLSHDPNRASGEPEVSSMSVSLVVFNLGIVAGLNTMTVPPAAL